MAGVLPEARDYQLNEAELQAIKTAIRRDKHPEVRQRCTVIRLAPEDVFILYTDGITEAQDAQGLLFDESRLQESVRTNLRRPASEIQEAVLADVHNFMRSTPQSDDIALVIIRRDSMLIEA